MIFIWIFPDFVVYKSLLSLWLIEITKYVEPFSDFCIKEEITTIFIIFLSFAVFITIRCHAKMLLWIGKNVNSCVCVWQKWKHLIPFQSKINNNNNKKKQIILFIMNIDVAIYTTKKRFSPSIPILFFCTWKIPIFDFKIRKSIFFFDISYYSFSLT